MEHVKAIMWAAKMVKIPSSLLLAICVRETGLQNTVAPHDGGSPSIGICQMKLATAQDLGFEGTAQDLMVPRINAYWAAMYLKWQMARYDDNWCKAVAAYNAGTFNESQIEPGHPRNLKYVRGVQRELASDLRPMLSCPRRKS
jgi:soluble lytic murein transglycosylase-like protein